MKRRRFIALLGGAAAWPLPARAQPPERMRRIGVLMNTTAENAEGRAGVAAVSARLSGFMEYRPDYSSLM